MIKLYNKWTTAEVIFAALALMFMLFLHGAIPFFMSPCAGQAIWTSGFAKSLSQGSFFNLYAHDIGFPKPAAISFGLAGAWPMSILIRLGLHPVNAYATICMLWLCVAFFSAYLMARKLGNSRCFALLGAVVWLSLPIIWYHAGYGVLFLGMSLLAFYFLATSNLFFIENNIFKISFSTVCVFFLATFISVFMDGYTFMMFFSGSTILFVFVSITRRAQRKFMLKKILPIYIGCFALSYIFYCAFIGRLNFNSHPIEVFRSYGVDLFFLAVPTQGTSWFLDLLGYNHIRSAGMYFGDPSVWKSTFLLPLMIAGVIAWWLNHKKTMAMSIFAVAFFAFYMSLGPSLKINSTIPLSLRPAPGAVNVSMESKLAVMPTGSGFFLKHLPGFNDMRAAYRWSALEAFSLWWLVMLGIAASKGNKKMIWCGVLFLLILFNLPHLRKSIEYHVNAHKVFFTVDQKLIVELKKYIQPNALVAFLPWGNDFLINYVAPMSGLRTYNIGGDKNLIAAQTEWPEAMLKAGDKPLNDEEISNGIKMLLDKSVDVLVLPYFNTLWRETWPCPHRGDLSCVSQRQIELQPFVEKLQAMPALDVIDTQFFAMVKLKASQ